MKKVAPQKNIHRARRAPLTYSILAVCFLLNVLAAYDVWTTEQLEVPVELLVGATLSIVIFLIARGESRARREAEHAAEELRISTGALRESEERYRDLYENANDLVYTHDLQGNFTSLNRAGELITGYTHEEALGMNVADIVVPEHIALARAMTARKVGDPAPTVYELDINTKGNKRVTLELSTRLIYKGGTPCGVQGIGRDITERTRAERERRIISEIIESVSATTNLDELLRFIHSAIGRILNAENCYIALLDEETGLLDMQFFIDKYDECPPPHTMGRGRTAYVFRTGRPVVMTDEVFCRLAEEGEVEQLGTPPPCWMGVPLRTASEIIGVLVVQHYEDKSAYTERDLEFLSSVGGQVALAIERKRAEEALKTREMQLAEAQQIAHVGSWEWDIAANKVGWSDELYRIFGLKPREFGATYEAYLNTLHPDDREAVADTIATAINDKKFKGFDHRIANSDGAIRFIRAEGKVVLDEQGTPVKMVGTAQDITERRRMEEALVEANRRAIKDYERLLERVAALELTLARARDRETVFRAVREFTQASVPCDGVTITLYDPARDMRVAAHAWCEGVEIDVSLLAPVRVTETGLASRAVRSGQVVVVNERFTEATKTIPIGTDDGMRPEASLIVPMLMTGRVIGTVEVQSYERGVYRDEHVTPMRMAANLTAVALENLEVETELRRARDAALESSRLKSQFLANMSHEIRTPMNGVIGMTELLLDSPLADDQRKFAEAIRTSADSLMTVINDILDFSKIEAGKLAFDIADFDLLHVVEGTAELLAGRAHAKGLDLMTDVEASVPQLLRGDAGRLRQVLTNLIGNAVKFTETGDVSVSVTRERETETHTFLRFEVCDTGIGITPEAQRELFQPFVQADGSTTRKYGGTGLGLAISKQLVDLMGGEVGVESVRGRGSTFWFTARFEKQPAGVQPRQPSPRTDLKGLRVLVVDDNATNRKILVHQTAARGMIGHEADSAERAIEMMREAAQAGHAYDLALLDLHMPGMDGLELARAISADPSISSVRLVLMPTFASQGGERRAREAGVQGYLVKPVRQSQLFDCLSSVMSACGERVGVQAEETPARRPRRELKIVPAPGRPRGRILVAEDNPVNQKVVLGQLSRLGYEADAVGNGLEALAALDAWAYELVLMDCQMPEMDGYEATAEIRRREADTPVHRRTCVVAMTAHAMQGEREKCLSAGMDDYVSKPMSLDDLRAVLTRQNVLPKATAQPESTKVNERQVVLSREPVLDRDALAALAELQNDSDADFVSKIVELFVEDVPVRLDALDEAATAGDARALARESHRLKSGCTNVGARRMGAVCSELERMGLSNEIEGVAALVALLRESFEKTRCELEAELQESVR